ncbi:MAG: hypothetical protein Unbinned5406contig1000_38 [Prokaryotic dsDNA virus sp.]|nr:MAG: hypothetical protein Unbinned5406contig1000_38 [Prokaryotic dsDNA virus sp.]|tara:strand:- start:1075 stop:1248 length:174 start_codon:yes stop_codon:yes gene_type:complete
MSGAKVKGVKHNTKAPQMHKGPIGLLELFVKGVDTITGYDRETGTTRYGIKKGEKKK